jgi:hypothetical protein
MQRKIKKLSISAEKGGLICFRPGDLMKQKITIKNNGQVWWTGFINPTEEEIAKGILQYNQVKISEYKNIGKENALKILERAQEILPAKISDEYEQFICDATPDEIFIEYEDGEFIFGQSIDFLTSREDLPNFYREIAEQVVIDNLLFCEDYVEYF